MKKIFLLFLLLQISFSFAQKSNVRAAYNYLKYQEIHKAKTAIDEAILHMQTKENDMAWYYRGMIYEAIYKHPIFATLDSNALKVAYDSYLKSLAIAPAGEFSEDIKTNLKLLAIKFMAQGIEEFNAKNYPSALESFETVLRISPDDTSAIFNAGFTADKLNDLNKSIGYYSKLIEMKNYEAKNYLLLGNAFKAKGDTAKALEIVINGRKLFPDDYQLLLLHINLILPLGKNKEATDLLKQAIIKDEKNESLYFALANTYDNLRIATKNTADSDDYFSLADVAYKKAIEFKPDFGDAYFNLGVMHFNRGAELANAANMLKDAVEYEKAKAKADDVFKAAKPYLEKALELNPKDVNILNTLKQLYVRTGETEKYNKVMDAIDGKKEYILEDIKLPPSQNNISPAKREDAKIVINMKSKGDTHVIPVKVNGLNEIDFIFDTGASETTITADVVMTLIRQKIVTQDDFLEGKIYKLADGSQVKSDRLLIRKLEIGGEVFINVSVAISSALAEPLLGQNVISKFKSVTVDNKSGIIILEKN